MAEKSGPHSSHALHKLAHSLMFLSCALQRAFFGQEAVQGLTFASGALWTSGRNFGRGLAPAIPLGFLRRLGGCVLALAAAAAPACAQSWSTAKSAQVDQIVAHFRELNGADEATLPSLSLSIGLDGRLAAAKGYGTSDGKPVTGGTLYEIGSITKQFTAAAALEMIKSGAVAERSGAKLSLTTPLSAVFGDSPYWKAQPWLTVGRLLTMRSNLPNFTRRPPDGANPWQPISAASCSTTSRRSRHPRNRMISTIATPITSCSPS